MKLARQCRSIGTFVALVVSAVAYAGDREDDQLGKHHGDDNVQLGPRPYYLVDKLPDGPLKARLKRCANDPIRQTQFAIGHRGGGTLQFPEHSEQSHRAGARMGAGILECDVTFTKDGTLVCRHDECDLHTTTNILLTPLAGKCSQPFSPAVFDASGLRTQAASALCCTSDLTVDEFKSLKAKMDSSDPNAKTPEQYQGGVPAWRTTLYSTGGTVLTHKESIRLIRSLGARFTPEAKAFNAGAKTTPESAFGTNPRQKFTQKIVDEYKAAGVSPHEVFAQSFFQEDIEYWIQNDPAFGRQAVYLDDRYATKYFPNQPLLDANDPSTWVPSMQEFRAKGYRIIAPPFPILLRSDDGKIVPSKYAQAARAAGLEIITWTLERSGRINEEVVPGNDFYYTSLIPAIKANPALQNDGTILVALDVLARQVGILGIFSDWAATPAFYANCMNL